MTGDLAKRLGIQRPKLRPELLLCENIPAPMHGLAPRVVLGQVWWDKTRKEAYRKALYCCMACGVSKHEAKGHKWLEGHEVYRVDYAKGLMHYVETVALCHYCHNYIHDGRLAFLLRDGLITHAKYAAILQHGDRVLAQAGLRRLSRQERERELMEALLRDEIAPWEEWRLVIGKKRYQPKYGSRKQWEAAMRKARLSLENRR